MKAILCASLLAIVASTASAAPVSVGLSLAPRAPVERRAHHCDTPAQIATNPICWKL